MSDYLDYPRAEKKLIYDTSGLIASDPLQFSPEFQIVGFMTYSENGYAPNLTRMRCQHEIGPGQSAMPRGNSN
jgi:hypothetical protein